MNNGLSEFYSKELPMIEWGKENGYKWIIGIRQAESALRSGIHSCMKDNGDFNPIYDFTDEIVNAMYVYFMIPIPKVYNYLTRTGCIGCPYGRNVEQELYIVTDAQRKFAIESFKKSYDVKGINYFDQQMVLCHYERN